MSPLLSSLLVRFVGLFSVWVSLVSVLLYKLDRTMYIFLALEFAVCFVQCGSQFS